MKLFKKVSALILILVLSISVFAGCTFTALKGGPTANSGVTSNGGLVVQKGNYVYFANGYTKTDDLENGDNRYGDVNYSALYRVKLDESNELTYNEDGTLKDAEVVVPKIVGFENCGIWIFDNNIYYATPNTDKNSEGKALFTLYDFCSAKLDGTNVQTLYKSDVESTSIKFGYYKIDGTVYLALYDSSKVILVNASTKESKVVAEGVSSVTLSRLTEYSASSSYEASANDWIYYTRSSVTSDAVSAGNIVAKAKISMGTETVLVKDNENTYSLNEYKNEKLYYTKKSSLQANTLYYAAKISTNSLIEETQLTFQTEANKVYALNDENGYAKGLITTNSNGALVWIKPNTIPESVVLYASKVTVLFIQNDYVYCYNENNELLRVNYKSGANQTITALTNKDTNTLKFDMNINVDYDNEYVYFYKEYKNTETGYYLCRLDVTNENAEIQLLGVVKTEHLPEVTEE